MQKKWVIISIIVILLAIVGVAAANALRYDGKLSSDVKTEVNDKANVNEVDLTYSLRLKKSESYPFKVNKEKDLKIKYTFDSGDNAIKVMIKDKGSQKQLHSFFISEEKGTEELTLPKGEYTMDIVVPSLSEGSAVISWK